MIAHAPFGPDSTKIGVEFSMVKARGRFETKNTIWMAEQFAEEISVISGYTKIIDELQKQFKAKPLTQESYAAAAVPFIQTQWPEPMPRTMSPALTNFAQPPSLPLLDSAQTTQQSSSPTPEKQ
jgi:hypothetical protein